MEVNLLPFLKKKEAGQTGAIVQTRTPDQKPEENQENQSAAIEACARELITAIHAKDHKSAANALVDAFDILESMPRDETEHSAPLPHSYDAQNIKAGENT